MGELELSHLLPPFEVRRSLDQPPPSRSLIARLLSTPFCSRLGPETDQKTAQSRYAARSSSLRGKRNRSSSNPLALFEGGGVPRSRAPLRPDAKSSEAKFGLTPTIVQCAGDTDAGSVQREYGLPSQL